MKVIISLHHLLSGVKDDDLCSIRKRHTQSLYVFLHPPTQMVLLELRATHRGDSELPKSRCDDFLLPPLIPALPRFCRSVSHDWMCLSTCSAHHEHLINAWTLFSCLLPLFTLLFTCPKRSPLLLLFPPHLSSSSLPLFPSSFLPERHVVSR